MNIICSGPDGSGKTTYLEKFQNEFKMDDLIHLTSQTPNDLAFHIDLLDSNKNVCFDRFSAGEMIFPFIYGREPKLTEYEFYLTLDKVMDNGDIYVIMTCSNADIIKNRLIERGELNYLEELPAQLKYYNLVANKMKSHFGDYENFYICDIAAPDAYTNLYQWTRDHYKKTRVFAVEEPIVKSYSNNKIATQLLTDLYWRLIENNIVRTGANASQSEGQESYVELLGRSFELDPYAPYITVSPDFKTPIKYVKNELDWYKSEDLSIIGHEGIESNPTWNACCTKDDKKEVNSNYGWCVFSEANGSQYDNCLEVLRKDPTSRNGIIVYQRPGIYKDYKRDGMHDMCCTFYSHFFIRHNRLYMIHRMRSNDIKFGFICSDLAWNCFVYQNMFEDLKKTYPKLEPASILWCSDSLHLYSRHYDILKEFVTGSLPRATYFDTERS